MVRVGFTLVEAIIAGAIFLLIVGAMIFTYSGSRRTNEVAALYLNLMENVALAMHQLRTDLRQLTFVPGKQVYDETNPANSYSILINSDSDPARRAIRLRRSLPAPVTSNDPGGSSFAWVDYALVPTDKSPNRFHIKRSLYTASGRNLPGKNVSREERIFRSFTLKEAFFGYVHDQGDRSRVLHVVLEIASDTGNLPNWGPFREKTMVVTNVLHIQRPEAVVRLAGQDRSTLVLPAMPMVVPAPSPVPSPAPSPLPTPIQPEIPPIDIVAPSAKDADPVPPFAF